LLENSQSLRGEAPRKPARSRGYPWNVVRGQFFPEMPRKVALVSKWIRRLHALRSPHRFAILAFVTRGYCKRFALELCSTLHHPNSERERNAAAKE
jgi:hypothetical protein